jgi:PadR family transcriptional regulator, regulatory protein AphA
MKPLGTTAYAILGLIAVQEGSAYELVKRMDSNYRFFWPRAQSHFYTEAKPLVARRLAAAANEATGKRPRTVYRITDAGRAALAAWLQTPASPPAAEIEGLLRVAYADFGTKEQLLAQVRAIGEHARAVLDVGDGIARAYAQGAVELPKRAHTAHLLWQFLRLQHEAHVHWAEWAEGEVAAWSSTRPGRAALDQATKFFAEAVRHANRGRPVPA